MEHQENQVVKMGEWMVTYLITMIPLIGIIMMFVWAFGSNTKPSKANWAKAALLWSVIIFVIYILIAVVFGATLFNAFNY